MSRIAIRIMSIFALFFFVMPNKNSYGKYSFTVEESAPLKSQLTNDDSPKPFPESEIFGEILNEQIPFVADSPGFSSPDGEIISIPQKHPTLHNRPASLNSNQENRITSAPVNGQQSTSASGIYGHVTLNGGNISGVSLQLRYYDGSTWSTRYSTSTDSSGNYSFTSAASLTTGERYYVLYKNSSYTSGRIWIWSTAYLTSYSSGDNVHIGDFDIADVEDFSPDYGKTVSLPTGFSWDKRPATPSDVYELELLNLSSDDFWFMTLGNNSSHTLNCLPSGFSSNTEYGWQVGITSPDGGYGYTFYYRIKFKNNPNCSGIHGIVNKNGSPMADVFLELRYTNNNGQTYSTRSESITGPDGSYKFVNIPSIPAGERYYIRFLSSYNLIKGILSYWGTNPIDGYTQNTDEEIEEFDITDIPLGSPANGSSITLPYTFTWSVRPATPDDNYYFHIYNTSSWIQIQRGYNNSFTIPCLYNSFDTLTDNTWLVGINPRSNNGAYGLSYHGNGFTISDGISCENTFLPTIIE